MPRDMKKTFESIEATQSFIQTPQRIECGQDRGCPTLIDRQLVAHTTGQRAGAVPRHLSGKETQPVSKAKGLVETGRLRHLKWQRQAALCKSVQYFLSE